MRQDPIKNIIIISFEIRMMMENRRKNLVKTKENNWFQMGPTYDLEFMG